MNFGFRSVTTYQETSAVDSNPFETPIKRATKFVQSSRCNISPSRVVFISPSYFLANFCHLFSSHSSSSFQTEDSWKYGHSFLSLSRYTARKWRATNAQRLTCEITRNAILHEVSVAHVAIREQCSWAPVFHESSRGRGLR